MTAVKIIKVLGTSTESWEAAAEEAVAEASETIQDISGVEVEDWTAEVDDGEIVRYKTTVEVAFPVRPELHTSESTGRGVIQRLRPSQSE
ncbi:dodecin family protein [Halomarina ordinaria]|uniref:Dodecin domain-containing protein n=1 Tax=Halomarina ordinaria TaxID=3033939 RepID=A0ABD5U6I5_9EURY|nr:dodecin family protein [Halomarina sp. PSRA2]